MDSEELYSVLFETERALECWKTGMRLSGRRFDEERKI